MKKFSVFLCGLAVFLFFVGNVNAIPTPANWTDEDIINRYIGDGQSYQYNHDLNDYGFDNIDDIITNYSLKLTFQDDGGFLDYFFDWEHVFINQPGTSQDQTFWTWSFIPDPTHTLNASVQGLLSLNSTGMLSITIKSLSGDFILKSSTLFASGTSGNAPVPEPATMLLLGTGLVGLAGISRKKLKK